MVLRESVGSGGDDASLDRGRETHHFSFQPLDLFGRHDRHLGPGHLGRQQFTVVGKILVHLHPGISIGHELTQA